MVTFSLSWHLFLVRKRKLCNRNNFNAYPTHFVLIKLCWLWRISENASLSYKTTVSNSQKSLIKGIQDKNSVHYFLQLMSVGLAWKSVAKSNEKLVNQKYATLFLSWMPFKDQLISEWLKHSLKFWVGSLENLRHQKVAISLSSFFQILHILKPGLRLLNLKKIKDGFSFQRYSVAIQFLKFWYKITVRNLFCTFFEKYWYSNSAHFLNTASRLSSPRSWRSL